MFVACVPNSPKIPSKIKLPEFSEQSTLSIGRNTGANADHSDVGLQDVRISRKHVIVSWDNKLPITTCALKIVGVNGVYVNNSKYNPGAEIPIKFGDVVAFLKSDQDDQSLQYTFLEIPKPKPDSPIVKQTHSTGRRKRARSHLMEMRLEEALGCEICHEIIAKAHSLQCGHTFCVSCIKTWIEKKKKKATCPMCRAEAKIEELQPSLTLDRVVSLVVDGLDGSIQKEMEDRLKEAEGVTVALADRKRLTKLRGVKTERLRALDYSDGEDEDDDQEDDDEDADEYQDDESEGASESSLSDAEEVLQELQSEDPLQGKTINSIQIKRVTGGSRGRTIECSAGFCICPEILGNDLYWEVKCVDRQSRGFVETFMVLEHVVVSQEIFN
eukprot:Filipodium_phascolosomae@DN2692_c2_g1_i4.p1